MEKTKGIIKSIKNNKIKPIYNDFTESHLESVFDSFKIPFFQVIASPIASVNCKEGNFK